MANECDAAILCLPDQAAEEAVQTQVVVEVQVVILQTHHIQYPHKVIQLLLVVAVVQIILVKVVMEETLLPLVKQPLVVAEAVMVIGQEAVRLVLLVALAEAVVNLV